MMASATPFFSVVVPVYNRAHMLGAALRSVLDQTDQDFEIIVVDDGSDDDPKAVVAGFADTRIRYHRQKNGGGGAARNTGIDLARGRFIAFLDSDDQFLPRHLERMRALLSDTSNTVGYARMIVDRGQGRMFFKPPRAIRPGEHMATYLLCDRGFVPTITVVVESAMAMHVRYSENLRAAEDTDFAIRLHLAGCKFVMAEEPGAIWKDIEDPHRTSAGRKGARLIPWLEKLRNELPYKAYYGCRGWAVAKGIAPTNRLRALQFYLAAVCRGCYSPGLAAIIFLQIFLPNQIYRRLADRAIDWLGDERRPQPPASASSLSTTGS